MDKGTCGPHLKLIYIYIYIIIIRRGGADLQWPSFLRFFFFFIYFLLFFFLIHRVSTIGIRRAKNESSSTRRGLRVSTKDTGFR